MDPDRLEQIESIYNDALALKPNERSAFLDRTCHGDADLRSEVESLLKYNDSEESYLDEPALHLVAHSLAQDSGVLVDRMLGRYQLLTLVGRGGMSEVFCAVDSRLNRLVAIKIVPAYMADDAERLRRIEQEAGAIASLNHPHICTLYDVGNDDDVHYLVFEYLVGEPLSERLAKGEIHPAEALAYTVQMAEALAYAHEHGIIHLDLKPSNIMITRTGVKLFDFGIAELHHPEPPHASTSANVAKPRGTRGTRGYMAPEQRDGRETDVRTDIFAFGTVVYEMFTGRPAFPRTTGAADAATPPEPPPIYRVQPLAPPFLDSFVARCLAQNPSERWQNMTEVLAGLRDIARKR